VPIPSRPTGTIRRLSDMAAPGSGSTAHIVAGHGNQWPTGLRCKRKSRWPVGHPTTADIDVEVAEASKMSTEAEVFLHSDHGGRR